MEVSEAGPLLMATHISGVPARRPFATNPTLNPGGLGRDMRVAGCNAARWPRPGFTFSRRSAAHPEAGAAVERHVVTRSARASWVPPLEIYRQISAAPTWTFNLNIRTLPGHVHRVFYVLPVVGGMGPWTGESGFPFGEFQQADTLACARFSLF